MNYTKNSWSQLKAITADKLVRAVLKDGFVLDEEVRTERIYRHPDGRRISIHYHKGSDGYGKGLIKSLLADAGWTEQRMKQLKLIK